MSIRNSASVNAVIPYNRMAEGSALTMTIGYLTYDVAGRPKPANPVTIEVTFYLPDGSTRLYVYPYNGDPGTYEIKQDWDGHFSLAVELDVPGRWRYVIVTNGGGGPGEDGEFEVVSAT